MSSLAPRNSHRIAGEAEWVESSDVVDLLPASVWAPDYEEEDETTLQRKRIDAQHIDLTSAENIEREAPVDAPRQVRILDESQVLPGEASFATVSLNKPLAESVLKPQKSWEQISASSIDDSRERKSASRVRLLDESWVPPGEASFATVLGERTQAHSPITEFLVKTKLSSKQLMLAMLALVSVLALAVIVLVSTTSSKVATVSSAPPPATLNTASQSVSTSVSKSPESFLISNSQGKVSGSVSPTQPVATVAEPQSVAAAKLTDVSGDDNSRKGSLSEAKPGAVPQKTPREVAPVGERVNSRKESDLEAKKQLDSVFKKALKKLEVANTPKAAVKSEPRKKSPEPAAGQSEGLVTVEKAEPKTPPTAGGGDRPRTVKPKPSP